jgi:hypothetical protein
MAATVLAVIERAYRGAVEVQYADLLYLCRGLRSQLGGLDLVLRGSAVTYALAAGPGDALRLSRADMAGATGHLPDPRAAITELIAAGSQVWADQADLAQIGATAGQVKAGVLVEDTDRLSLHWHEYREVWYL